MAFVLSTAKAFKWALAFYFSSMLRVRLVNATAYLATDVASVSPTKVTMDTLSEVTLTLANQVTWHAAPAVTKAYWMANGGTCATTVALIPTAVTAGTVDTSTGKVSFKTDPAAGTNGVGTAFELCLYSGDDEAKQTTTATQLATIAKTPADIVASFTPTALTVDEATEITFTAKTGSTLTDGASVAFAADCSASGLTWVALAANKATITVAATTDTKVCARAKDGTDSVEQTTDGVAAVVTAAATTTGNSTGNLADSAEHLKFPMAAMAVIGASLLFTSIKA